MCDRLRGLDALRGIAALVVVFHHLAAIAGKPIPPFFAAIAVDMFFVISGFVMERTYARRMRDGSLGVIGFLVIRYRRLFAPLAIGTTLGAAYLLLAGLRVPIVAFVFAIGFMPAFWLPRAFPFNVPAWSLFAEIVVNALHLGFARLSGGHLKAIASVSALVSVTLLWFGYARWRPIHYMSFRAYRASSPFT